MTRAWTRTCAVCVRRGPILLMLCSMYLHKRVVAVMLAVSESWLSSVTPRFLAVWVGGPFPGMPPVRVIVCLNLSSPHLSRHHYRHFQLSLILIIPVQLICAVFLFSYEKRESQLPQKTWIFEKLKFPVTKSYTHYNLQLHINYTKCCLQAPKYYFLTDILYLFLFRSNRVIP